MGSYQRNGNSGHCRYGNRHVTDTTKMKKDVKKPCSLNCDLLRNKFNQLQEEYKKLLAVTSELTNALQMNIMGQAQNVNYVLEECRNIYPSLFETQAGNSKSGFWECSEEIIESQVSHGEEGVVTQVFEKSEPECVYSDVPELNLDFCQHKESASSSNHISPHTALTTPLTQREIRSILESILKRVLSVLEQNEQVNDGDGRYDCCDTSQTCNDCKNEISKMLNRVVLKVLESPRCKTSNRRSPIRCNSASTASCRVKLDLKSHSATTENKVEEEYHIKVPSDVENKAANVLGSKEDKDNESNGRHLLSREQTERIFSMIPEDVRGDQDRHKQNIDHQSNDMPAPHSNNNLLKNEQNEVHPLNSPMPHCSKRACNQEELPKNLNSQKICVEQRSPRESSQNLNSKRIKEPVFRYFSYAKTPMCYLEHCRLLQDGNRNCRCMKCVPGQSRYYCGCYDIISREIDEEVSDICKEQTSIRTNYFKNIHRRREIGIPPILEQYIYGSKCSLCEDMICKCAFESRPKLRRTPPE
ncbi:unnamed protein product [Callosobruchus maculatus]|uniref:Uncharacterized protein n=1 Tax=Callosobruchus maculatus TaxID=64391 RepID=A0A653DM18_CALMS|nr:unnamed protein product [Callosobruchus maculatus]